MRRGEREMSLCSRDENMRTEMAPGSMNDENTRIESDVEWMRRNRRNPRWRNNVCGAGEGYGGC